MKTKCDEELYDKSKNNTIYFCETCFNFVSRFHAYQKKHKQDMPLSKFYKRYLKDDGTKFLELAKKLGFFFEGYAICPGWSIENCFSNEIHNAGLSLWGDISMKAQKPSSEVFKPYHSPEIRARMTQNAKNRIKSKSAADPKSKCSKCGSCNSRKKKAISKKKDVGEKVKRKYRKRKQQEIYTIPVLRGTWITHRFFYK